MTFVPSEVITKSTASLDKDITKELGIPDPVHTKAQQAIAKATESKEAQQ